MRLAIHFKPFLGTARTSPHPRARRTKPLRPPAQHLVLFIIVLDTAHLAATAQPVKRLIREEDDALRIVHAQQQRRRGGADAAELRELLEGGGDAAGVRWPGRATVRLDGGGNCLARQGRIVGRGEAHEHRAELAVAELPLHEEPDVVERHLLGSGRGAKFGDGGAVAVLVELLEGFLAGLGWGVLVSTGEGGNRDRLGGWEHEKRKSIQPFNLEIVSTRDGYSLSSEVNSA